MPKRSRDGRSNTIPNREEGVEWRGGEGGRGESEEKEMEEGGVEWGGGEGGGRGGSITITFSGQPCTSPKLYLDDFVNNVLREGRELSVAGYSGIETPILL